MGSMEHFNRKFTDMQDVPAMFECRRASSRVWRPLTAAAACSRLGDFARNCVAKHDTRICLRSWLASFRSLYHGIRELHRSSVRYSIHPCS